MNWTPLRATALVLAAGWLPHACEPESSEAAANTTRRHVVTTGQSDVVDFLFWPAAGWKRIELELALEDQGK